jgi:hypothetical protein
VSRSYNISDFAAFLRKHGGSGQDRVDRDEDSVRDGSHRTVPEREGHQHSSQPGNKYGRSRTIYRSRHREYSLRESEVQTLTDLGKFRIVPADDLVAQSFSLPFSLGYGSAKSWLSDGNA